MRRWRECIELNDVLKVLETCGLPVSFTPRLVRAAGVEPASSGWKPEALATKTKHALIGAGRRNRTGIIGVALRGPANRPDPRWRDGPDLHRPLFDFADRAITISGSPSLHKLAGKGWIEHPTRRFSVFRSTNELQPGIGSCQRIRTSHGLINSQVHTPSAIRRNI